MRGKPETFTGFTEGLNLADSPYMLNEREARDLRNCVATGRGAVRKRDGNVTFSGLGGQEPVSLFLAQSPDIGIGQSTTMLFTINTGGGYVGSVATGLTASARWEWAQGSVSGGQGPIYGMNGVDAPRYHTGGAIGLWTASSGTLPNGRWLKWMQNRMLVAGDAANPYRLYGSKILDPRLFTSPDGWAVDIDASDGQPLAALGSVGPYAIVFKSAKTYIVYDLDTGANRRISDSVGCVAPRSVVETPEGTFFLARDGIYKTNGSSVERVSDRIQPLLTAMVTANISKAAGTYFDRHYYLSISTSGSANNLLLDYDMRLNSWWVHTVGANQLAPWAISGAVGLYGARSGANIVERYFVPGQTQDSGSNFESYFATAHHSFGSPYVRKRVRRIHFDGKGRIQLSIAKDFQSVPVTVPDELNFSALAGQGNWQDATGQWATADAGIWGAARDIEEAIVHTPGVARTWGLTFGNSTSDPWEIESVTLNIETRRN